MREITAFFVGLLECDQLPAGYATLGKSPPCGLSGSESVSLGDAMDRKGHFPQRPPYTGARYTSGNKRAPASLAPARQLHGPRNPDRTSAVLRGSRLKPEQDGAPPPPWPPTPGQRGLGLIWPVWHHGVGASPLQGPPEPPSWERVPPAPCLPCPADPGPEGAHGLPPLPPLAADSPPPGGDKPPGDFVFCDSTWGLRPTEVQD
ncbi:PREDICTED: basic proline-rich protein-like [Myotis brandtii]|uniref:basic proline-rich protein-like n=1 Tax=Myotis brandtii TaxID=109478 RepID=UPI00070440BA|nr:PREDICTED: basic proline-rich protein-like [Myotis brandtii]